MKLGGKRALVAIGLWAGAVSTCALAADASPGIGVRLSGHVLPVLGQATPVPQTLAAAATANAESPMTVTVVLRRSDPSGFQAYLADIYDPSSVNFRKFLSPTDVSERYGPTAQDYALVSNYFTDRGFALGEGSANRMTLTFRTTRAVAAQTLAVDIGDYVLGDRTFYTNDRDPTLPEEIASRVESVMGLANLARPAANPQPQFYDNLPNNDFGKYAWYALCANYANNADWSAGAGTLAIFEQLLYKSIGILGILNQLYNLAQLSDVHSGTYPQYIKCATQWKHKSAGGAIHIKDPPPPAWQGADGTGQTVGLLQFDTFLMSDVVDYVNLVGQSSGPASNVSQVHVNGGATLGANQTEVLLDIASVLTAAPGAKIIVFDGPFTGGGTSFQAMFNAMINGGVTIISNSWAYCEDQTTMADVQSIDTILQTAAASGISVFTGAGDHGSTCLDGSPNTSAVPATSPHITAVGGTSQVVWPGFTYGSETWWDGSASTPPGGQGGYGVSRFFARPTYQNGASTSTVRSVPDVSTNADPQYGIILCQASDGGCPTGKFYGGTSMSAPLWAGFAAMLNQTQGHNLGFLNPLLYPLANSSAFHNAASMGSDFAHVGLGSPNLGRMHQALAGLTIGVADPAVSQVRTYGQTTFALSQDATVPLPSYADGTTQTFVVVTLLDANGIAIGGKNILITANAGSHAVISPPNAPTGLDTGVALFFVTDTTVETVTLTATDTTDGVTLGEQPRIQFFAPPSASGGISAGPTAVQNDGMSITTITVTLQDEFSHPSPGKLVQLAQGGGHSVVSGPNPSVTNASGQIQFTATNRVPETVTYTAVDVTDDGLAIPGSAVVTFGGQGDSSCFSATQSAAPGFTLTPVATGFPTGTLFFGNVNWNCRGVSYPAFTPDGAMYANDFLDGSVYKFPGSGGVANNGTKLSALGPTLFGPAIGKDGKMYAARGATTGNFTTGTIFEIDPATGAIIRTVMGGLTCPTNLTVDPLSGDLFASDSCSGAGSDNPSLWRISNPASATPTLSVYATLGATPSPWFTVAPNGTIYIPQSIQGPPGAPVLAISGTDKPFPPTITPVPNLTTIYWLGMGEALPNGAAKSLVVLQGTTIRLANITTDPPTYTDLIENGPGSGMIGPDGCLYVATPDTIYKLAPTSGGCGFASTSPAPALRLTPASVSPDPPQGTTQSFTATFANVSVPPGTPVLFDINGANSRVMLGTTNASGAATISYKGALTGTDTVRASGVAGTTTLTSGPAQVTWAAGSHLTFLDLSLSPNTGVLGKSLTLRASLSDATLNPLAAVPGATIQFVMGAQSCSGVTNASGVAACAVMPNPSGSFTLTATFAGNASFTPTSATQQIAVLAQSSSVAPQPLALDFGNQNVATTSSARTVVLNNAGTLPFTLTTIAISGTNPGDFALAAGANQCVVAGAIPANGGSCTLYLTFTPGAAGARGAVVTVTDSGTGGAVPVPLTGTGTPPLTLIGAASRKTHGTAGTFDLPLSLNPLTPNTEPRTGGGGGNHTLVFTFSKPMVSGNAAVTEGTATAGAPTFNGNEMTIPLSNVTNVQYVTVTVSNVVSGDGGPDSSGSVRLGFLFGDVNQSRQVLVSDVGNVNAKLLQTLTVANFLLDVNVDGKLTVSDVGLTNANLLKKLPAP